ncbi:MAG: peroxidase family protein, partial [Gammaproteobacteria bacterium]
QILIAEAHAAESETIGFQVLTLEESREILLSLVPNSTSFQGLRTVDGSLNNLVPGQELFGAQETEFPRSTDPLFRDGELIDLGGGPMPTSFEQTSGIVAAGELRTISNLIVDQTVNNPAATDAADGEPTLVTINPVTGLPVDLNFIPNAAPDEGLSASFNAWFTFFGQFFDHGLDFIAKGGSGFVFMPLQPDDPLFDPASPTNFLVLTRATNLPGPDGILGDDPLTPLVDESADDIHEFINTDTPFVDQNQTFGENASHQVFLRAYELNGAGEPKATGKLLNDVDLVDGIYGNDDDIPLGGMATWGVLKAQSRDILGIELDDLDVLAVPEILVDQYGNFIPGAAGLPQLILTDGTLLEGDLAAPVDASLAARTTGNFLADIAHNAAPVSGATPTGPGPGGITPLTPDSDTVINPIDAPLAVAGTYDDELLDAHFVTGDGRANENIALTTVHHVFHAEHNRLVDETKAVLLGIDDSQAGDALADQDANITLSPLELLNSFLLVDVASIAAAQADPGALVWNGERLFQTAKFGTEMQYQHLVFEEFARKLQPAINEFEAIDISIDPSITLEFSQAVYRFGHSMLVEEVDRFDPDFASSEIGLIEAFLNPLLFNDAAPLTGVPSLTPEEAAGALVRGLTRQVGNEIDEFVTDAVRNNRLGLPLDLAAINIARGRDVGIPPLNAVRADFFEQTGLTQLKPYTSWVDFALHAKHELSVVNFIAAYGTHSDITSATTLVDKRAAALDIVLGAAGAPVGPADAFEFMNSIGAWADDAGVAGRPNDVDGVTTTGLGNVDLWIGGLAEEI